MKLKIIALGNFIGFTIPIDYSRELHLEEGMIVHVKFNDFTFLKKLTKPSIYNTKEGKKNLFKIVLPKIIAEKYGICLGQEAEVRISL